MPNYCCPKLLTTRPMCRSIVQKLCAGCWFWWPRLALLAVRDTLEKRHQSRVTSPADLEPPNGLGLGLRLGLGWSGPTCEVEIDHTSCTFFFEGCSCTLREPL